MQVCERTGYGLCYGGWRTLSYYTGLFGYETDHLQSKKIRVIRNRRVLTVCEVGGWLMFVCLLYCSISDWKNRSVYTWVLVGMSIMALVFCICFSRESGWSIVGGAIIGILFSDINSLTIDIAFCL